MTRRNATLSGTLLLDGLSCRHPTTSPLSISSPTDAGSLHLHLAAATTRTTLSTGTANEYGRLPRQQGRSSSCHHPGRHGDRAPMLTHTGHHPSPRRFQVPRFLVSTTEETRNLGNQEHAMTDRRENSPPPEGWTLPPRCCGQWVSGLTCGVCGRWSHEIPANIVLSDN